MYYFIYSAIAILIITNLISIYFLFKKKPPQEVLTKSAEDLLANLFSRGAVCIVEIANPSEMFLYSPKDIK